MMVARSSLRWFEFKSERQRKDNRLVARSSLCWFESKSEI